MLQSRKTFGDGPYSTCSAPRKTGAKTDGCGNQQDLYNAVYTGIGITENDVPQGIGKKKSRHKDHQGADNNGICSFR